MKYNYLFIFFLGVILFSCSKENGVLNVDSTIELTEQQDVSVSEGRLVFKSKNDYFKTLNDLRSLSTEEQIKWGENIGFKSYLSGTYNLVTIEDTISKPDIMRVLGSVYNRNRELQIADTLYWFHNEVEYLITNNDIQLYRQVQDDVLSGKTITEQENLKVNFLTVVTTESTENEIVRNKIALKGYRYEFKDGPKGKTEYQMCWDCSLYLGIDHEYWELEHFIQYKKKPLIGSNYWELCNTRFDVSGYVYVYTMAQNRNYQDVRHWSPEPVRGTNIYGRHFTWDFGVMCDGRRQIHYFKARTEGGGTVTIKNYQNTTITHSKALDYECKVQPYKNYIFDEDYFGR